MHSPRAVMVVDDDDDIRFLISQSLRQEGYKVTEAATAADARLTAMTELPGLVLMDLSMPDVDGLSAIWELRKLPQLATVPVVIVSAHDAFDLRAEAAAAGCAGYITKPIDLDELKSVVRSTLGSVHENDV